MEARRKIDRASESSSPHAKLLPPLFPSDQHLLITTEKKIYVWSSAEKARVTFASPNGGIVAAKEAEDGSGLLAVADSQVVVLCKQGETRKRWKLKADEGRVAQISFANGYKDIFFSTSLQTSLRRYSVEEDRLLEFSCTHPSLPAAIAISRNSTYLVSASPSPPIAYLQDLRIPGSKIQFKPHASDAQVTVASFHPDRDEIFLLAYSDGTLSVHTASRIILMKTIGSDGNIGHLKRVHYFLGAGARRHERKTHRRRFSSTGSVTVEEKCVPITAAAFVSGHKLRVVSVASDGKCRVADFEHGASILRTWYTHAACTSLAISAHATNSKPTSVTDGEQERNSASSYMIAVGRADGCLHLFDALGLPRDHMLMDRGRGRIVDLAWVPNEKRDLPTAILAAEQVPQPDISDVDWTFRHDIPNVPSTPQHPKSNIENESPPIRLLDSLRSKRAAPFRISTAEPPFARATAEGRPILTPPNHNADSNPSPSSTLLESLRTGWAISSPFHMQKMVKDCIDSKDCDKSGLELKDASPNQMGSKTPFVDATSPTSALSMSRTKNFMPCAWVESSSSFGSLHTDPMKRSSLRSPLSKFIRLPRELHDHHTEKCMSHRGDGLNQSPSPLPSSNPPLRRSENPNPLKMTETSPKFAMESEFEGTPTRSESRRHDRSIRDHTLGGAGRPSRTLRRTRPVSHLTETISLAPRQNLDNEFNEDDSNGVPYAPPQSASLSMKALPKTPSFDSEPTGECDCSNVIRQEMALVRAEIAALRKGLWVFGGQIEMAASALPNGLQQSGQRDWFADLGKKEEKL